MFFGLLGEDKRKDQAIKQDEITGRAHRFHSLPKEFQAWHNMHYMMEKKSKIDKSTVSESLLNGYMWKSIDDGTKYALYTMFYLIISVLKLRLAPSNFGLIVSLSMYSAWVIFLAYHFLFYAKIRAQVVGDVTRRGYLFTAQTFYATFYGIVISLSVAFAFILSMIEDIAKWLFDYIQTMGDDSFWNFAGAGKDFLIYIYNFLVDLIYGPESMPGALYHNTYFEIFLFLGVTLLTTFFSERYWYNEKRAEVDAEIMEEKLNQGYPLDRAFLKIKKWREDHFK